LQVSRRENQVVHDRCVESLARRLSLEGWMVEAHVQGWPKPAYIGGICRTCVRGGTGAPG